MLALLVTKHDEGTAGEWAGNEVPLQIEFARKGWGVKVGGLKGVSGNSEWLLKRIQNRAIRTIMCRQLTVCARLDRVCTGEERLRRWGSVERAGGRLKSALRLRCGVASGVQHRW